LARAAEGDSLTAAMALSRAPHSAVVARGGATTAAAAARAAVPPPARAAAAAALLARRQGARLAAAKPAQLARRAGRNAAGRATGAPPRAAGAAGDDVPPGYGDMFPPPKPLRRSGVLMHPTSLPVRRTKSAAVTGLRHERAPNCRALRAPLGPAAAPARRARACGSRAADAPRRCRRAGPVRRG
jgi:hypothetical protein